MKICGITRPEDALLAEELGASAVGFVFYPGSPRYIDPEEAKRISGALGPFITRVGVFVDEDIGTVQRIVETAGLTAVQLHGSEDQGYIDAVKGVRVLKALRVGPDFDFRLLDRYRVAAFLLDAWSEKEYGGTGRTFDWEKARECGRYGRIILAGGLTASNVEEALATVCPWGVDVSSGVEQSPGIKDHDKLRAFADAVKSHG